MFEIFLCLLTITSATKERILDKERSFIYKAATISVVFLFLIVLTMTYSMFDFLS